MNEKILLSFRSTETDQKLLEYLKIKGEVIGKSSYIKQLIYEDMLRNKDILKEPKESKK